MTVDKSVSHRSTSQQSESFKKSSHKKQTSRLSRARARYRWKRIQRHVRSASLAFSSAGLERRQGFVARKWSTIPYQVEKNTVEARRLSYAYGCQYPEAINLLSAESKYSTSLNTPSSGRSKEKSVSFDDDPDYGVRTRLNR